MDLVQVLPHRHGPNIDTWGQAEAGKERSGSGTFVFGRLRGKWEP